MAKLCSFILFHVYAAILLLSLGQAADEDREVSIIYMGSLRGKNIEYSPLSHHFRLLEEVIGSSNAANYFIRSYNRSFNGFAAKLTESERKRLANTREVVSVFKSKSLKLQTTRSWDFMGFTDSVRRSPSYESNVIVGMLDSGIWPESESFTDGGFVPPPDKWKGACNGGSNFSCNNKVIGARDYTLSTARDQVGHGSHTSSIVAGNKVKDASFYGIAQGTARGGVPSARIAVYKVCDERHCPEAAILAAFDDAIADGVDIVSICIGGSSPTEFDRDAIAIGAFHATEKGIFTSHSAGNNGPSAGSVTSIAPWILTVAASTIDRKIVDTVLLANGVAMSGTSVNSFTMNGTRLPLVYGKEVSKSTCTEEASQACDTGCLDSTLVKGKIVLCDRAKTTEACDDGASGAILMKDQYYNDFYVVPFPALDLDPVQYDAVKQYKNSSGNPLATILKSQAIIDFTAPLIASFSARGPNVLVPEIIKPDVTGPGVDILAAYSLAASPSNSDSDKRRVSFSIRSGTSMSCPHASAAVAYVKSFHTNWSPSAIKSALMTTARPMLNAKGSGGEFGYGSGHIDPVKAIEPGLVYEVFEEDYIKLLCSIGYDENKVRLITGHSSTCPEDSTQASAKDFNYPSMAAKIPENKPFTITFNRTVKNVGVANSTYKAYVFQNSKLTLKVDPAVLKFQSMEERKSFFVTVSGQGLPAQSMISASLHWSDGTHIVRSPIVVHTMTGG